MSAFAMTSSSTSTQAPTLFGRGGYNGDDDSDDDSRQPSGFPANFGRGGYNKSGDDDEEEDGRGGYN